MVSQVLKLIDCGIEVFCRWSLVVALLGMLGLTLFNIASRWFGISWPWIEPLVRHLVFAAAFLGGALATGEGRHININIFAKFLEAKGLVKERRVIEIIIAAVSIVVLVWLIYAGVELAKVEFQYGKPVFLDLHSGYLISIIPVGFALIAWRYLYQLYRLLLLWPMDQSPQPK